MRHFGVFFKHCVEREFSFLFPGATIMECVVYSKVMRISYVIAICFAVGFVAPWFINQRLAFTPESHEVAGTCHIMMGLRMNCFPDLTNNQ